MTFRLIAMLAYLPGAVGVKEAREIGTGKSFFGIVVLPGAAKAGQREPTHIKTVIVVQDSARRLRMPSAKSLSSDATRRDGNTNLEALEVISLVR